MTKDEALKLALEALNEVRQETFRLMRNGQTLYAEDKVWSTIISIKEVLAQEQEPVAVKHMMRWVNNLKWQSDNGQHMNIPSGLSSGTCWELAIELENFIKHTNFPQIAINPEIVGYVAPQRMAKRIEDLETEQDCVGWFGYDTGLRLWFETNKGDDGAIPLYKRRRTHD